MITLEKSAHWTAYETNPLIGSEPPARLRDHFITPAEAFFVRNHGPIPEIDPSTYRLEITGLVRQPISLSLAELQSRFPRVSVTATLQCAGNRRDELNGVAAIPQETLWGANAIGNAHWSGFRLRDVLETVQLLPESEHVAFSGWDLVSRLGTTFPYGSSIDINKALRPEVILADEMNGKPLSPEHGFPLRVVVPGFIGARNVKWLRKITVQAEPSENYFQRRAYRLFPPYDQADTVQWDTGLMLSEYAVNSVICLPHAGAVLPAGETLVQGYALSGGDRHIVRVDLSADGGKTWLRAALKQDQPWAWQFWEATLDLSPGATELVVRAVDSAANVQPANLADVWNFKGYMNNAWHRVQIVVQGA